MKKVVAKYLFLLSLIVFFTTCKKYPEGGYESRGDKIVFSHEGKWILTLYEVNGIDSTDLINYNGNEDYKDITFLKEGGSSSTKYARHYPNFDYLMSFRSNNEIVHFLIENISYYNMTRFCVTNSSVTSCWKLIFNPEGKETDWKIIKLTKKEFILKTKGINSYVIKLKAK